MQQPNLVKRAKSLQSESLWCLHCMNNYAISDILTNSAGVQKLTAHNV